MTWRWTQHFLLQLKERDLKKELIESALTNPDCMIAGKKNRMIYQKIVSGKLLRIVTEGDLLITVYITDKIRKYMKEGK